MTIDSASIQSQAKSLAQYEVQREMGQVKRSSEQYKAQLAAVSTLDKALKSFGSAVKGMQGTDKSMLVSTAKFSKEGMASATLGAKAQEGRYQLFITQLASAHQLSLSGLGSDVGVSGSLSITQNGDNFQVGLAAADSDSDGKVSQEELAAAINKHSDNKGVKATLVRSQNGVSLVLTAQKTGAASRITLSSVGANSQLTSSLAGKRDLSAGADAVVHLGGENGLRLEQSSNTFKDLIEGVSLTVSKAHSTGETPLILDISRDKSATKAKVNEFITAINGLLGTFDSLSAPGGEKGGRGALAGDASIRAVKTLLNTELRKSFSGAGGKSLMDFGLRAAADGKLKLDDKAFDKMLDTHPQALDKLFTGKDQLLDSLSKKLATFTSGSSGSMKARKDNLNTQLQRVEEKRKGIDKKYAAHYQRYLKQYSAMAQVVASMEQTFRMFQTEPKK
ncbi:Flagellar hook-associated protein 2 [compost metagenome]